MPTPTVATLQTRLDRYYAAEASILETAQRYKAGPEHEHEMARLDIVQRAITQLERQISAAGQTSGPAESVALMGRRGGYCG